jgi:precorrin-2 dehydrogenase/sirohydrochlorin ferrochelatase
LKGGEKLISYYPAFLRLEGKKCVVIGGGKVAERKILSLLEANAIVVLVSPDATPFLAKLAEEGKITWIKDTFKPDYLEGAWLVFACTNQREVQREVFQACEERKIFCNVVDQPDVSSFIVPSVVKRGALTLAISTSGASPAVSRRLRERLERLFGEEYASYLELMRRIRELILSKGLPQEEKERKLQVLALAPLDIYLKNKDYTLIKAILEKEGLSEVIPEFEPLFHDKASIDNERPG